ncbi:MAG: hypothetical protein KGH60_04445 [Candidatus Micrarchaeota archaeon]|nr:hypothetical protein [Candidatus Micrarchaeota archaeon]
MIYVFGSNHLDGAEIPEIKAAFKNLGGGLHLGIELTSDADTNEVLARIRNADDKELRRIIRKHYAGPPSNAYFNLLKLLSKDKGTVSEIFTIEKQISSRGDKRLSHLSTEAGQAWDQFETEMRAKGKKDPDKLLRFYHQLMKKTFDQCLYREKAMVKRIDAHLKANPKCNLFIYCGYYHQPYITAHLRRVRRRFTTRPFIAAKHVEDYVIAVRKLANKYYSKMTDVEKLELGQGLLLDLLYFYLKERSIQTDYKIVKQAMKGVSTLEQFGTAVQNFGTLAKKLA